MGDVTVSRFGAAPPAHVAKLALAILEESTAKLSVPVTFVAALEWDPTVARNRLMTANQPQASIDALVAHLAANPGSALVEVVFTAPASALESRPDAFLAGKVGRRQ